MAPRKKWPEEADWARLDTISMLKRVVILLVIASNITTNQEVLRILNLIIALINICNEWLKDAKGENVPKELDKKYNDLIASYMNE